MISEHKFTRTLNQMKNKYKRQPKNSSSSRKVLNAVADDGFGDRFFIRVRIGGSGGDGLSSGKLKKGQEGAVVPCIYT